MSIVTLPDLDLLPADALRALIRAQHEQLLSHENEIAHLKLLIAKLERMQFGRKSEKLQRQIEQLELRLEELEANRSAKPLRRNSRLRHPHLRILLQPKPRGGHCQSICQGKHAHTPHRKRYVRNARASCASWARMSRRCWSTCRPVSW